MLYSEPIQAFLSNVEGIVLVKWLKLVRTNISYRFTMAHFSNYISLSPVFFLACGNVMLDFICIGFAELYGNEKKKQKQNKNQNENTCIYL